MSSSSLLQPLPERAEITEQSALYRDIKSALKYLVYALTALFVLYAIYKLFDLWLFAGVVIVAPYFYVLIKHLIRVPKELILVLNPAEGDLSLVGMSTKKLREYEHDGNPYYVLSSCGERLLVVDGIDYENKRLLAPWFAGVSNLEFLKSAQAFERLKSLLTDELRENSTTRACLSVEVERLTNERIKRLFEHYDSVMFPLSPAEGEGGEREEVEHEHT